MRTEEIDISLPIIQKIEEWIDEHPERICMVSVDGMSASGKSSLGELLYQKFGGMLIHMDDFFLRPEQRTLNRMQETGGNVDYERFRLEVLQPLKQGKKEILYRRYDCKTQAIQEGKTMIVAGPVCVVEGAYSNHPYFGESYHLRVLLTVDSEVQKERIRKRNGEAMLERFVNMWIPMENRYLSEFSIREKCDFVLDTSRL